MKPTHVFTLVAFLIATTIPASATFPGKNGRIAFVSGPDIYTMNPDGSNVRQLTHMTGDNSASWESWSADGKQIVFNEFLAPDFNGQLWIMNADGSNQHLLLAEPGITEERPSFSPDGTTVVFSRGYDFSLDSGRPLIVQLYTINVDGSRLTQITSHTTIGVHDFGPRYSPDGKTLFFQADQAGGILDAVYSLPADGDDSPYEITPAVISGRRHDVSPDGKTIAFQTHCCNPQNETIALIGIRGTDMREITHNGDDYDNGPHDFNPSWSPAGDMIVFERQTPDPDTSGIYVINVESGRMEHLIRLPAVKAAEVGAHSTRLAISRGRTKPGKPHEIQQGGSLARWGAMPH